MKGLAESLKESLDEARLAKGNAAILATEIESAVTQSIINVWDEKGIELTRKDIVDALESVAKSYEVNKHIDWANKLIK